MNAFCSELNPKTIIIYHKVLLYIPAAADIKCFVGEGDIPVVDYLPQECGGLNNACVKTELTEKTTRACGVGVDVCVGNTCTCTSSLCNGGSSFEGTHTMSLAILSFNVAIAAFVRRMI